MRHILLPKMSTYSDIPNATRVASAPDHWKDRVLPGTERPGNHV